MRFYASTLFIAETMVKKKYSGNFKNPLLRISITKFKLVKI
jgi:hypothetical protein